MTAGRGLVRLAAASAVVLAALLAGAPAAGAHGTSGPPASNFSTTLAGIRPPARGVVVRLDGDGERIVLEVTAPHTTVVVDGYSEEPYLRIGPHGVFENRSSPAVVLNRSRIPTGRPPSGPIRAPRWVEVSAGHEARWHDHRTHWMGGATPVAVRRAPDRGHTVAHWEIPLHVDGRSTVIAGTIRWDPPPAAGWWWLLAAVLLAAVVVAARFAARTTALAALVVLTVGEALHLWGTWPFSNASTVGRVGENVPSIAAVLVAACATVWVARRGVWSGAPLLIVAGLFCFVAGGLSDLPVLSHAWVPSRLDPALARTLVSVSLGVGAGVIVIGATRLRPAPAADRLSG